MESAIRYTPHWLRTIHRSVHAVCAIFTGQELSPLNCDPSSIASLNQVCKNASGANGAFLVAECLGECASLSSLLGQTSSFPGAMTRLRDRTMTTRDVPDAGSSTKASRSWGGVSEPSMAVGQSLHEVFPRRVFKILGLQGVSPKQASGRRFDHHLRPTHAACIPKKRDIAMELCPG